MRAERRDTGREAAGRVAGARLPGARGRIPAVEDEPDVAELIRYNLAREGSEVACAATGAEEGDSPRELVARVGAVVRRGRAAGRDRPPLLRVATSGSTASASRSARAGASRRRARPPANRAGAGPPDAILIPWPSHAVTSSRTRPPTA